MILVISIDPLQCFDWFLVFIIVLLGIVEGRSFLSYCSEGIYLSLPELLVVELQRIGTN